MKKPYLLCLDGSTFSDRALEWCINHLDAQRDAIHILQVNEKPGSREYNEQIQTVAEEARSRLESAEFTVRTKTLTQTGSPGPLICRYAEQNDAEAIVMGRRGQNPIMGWLAGSVSQYVFFNATRPVITVPQRTETTYYNWGARMQRDLVEQLLDLEFDRRHAEQNNRRPFPSLERQPDIRFADEHGESRKYAFLIRPSELHEAFFRAIQSLERPDHITLFIPSHHLEDVQRWFSTKEPPPSVRSYRIFNGILVTYPQN